MLDDATVREVIRLLAEGTLSQRKIARRLGVSRGIVGAIAKGKRRVYKRPVPEEEPRSQGPPARCPECGALVRMPCRLCATRRLLQRKHYPRRPASSDDDLRLQLRPHHQARYEEVRAIRRRLGEEATAADFAFDSERESTPSAEVERPLAAL